LLKREEKSDTYLIHICRLPQSVKSLERPYEKLELSDNTVAFISCRSRLAIMLADVARGQWGKGKLGVAEAGFD